MHTQAPPEVAERVARSPSSCQNASKEQSLSVTTSVTHPGTNSFEISTSSDRISAATATRDLVTSKGSTEIHKLDQWSECTDPSHPVNHNGDDKCHSNTPMPAHNSSPRPRSISPSQEDPMDIIVSIDYRWGRMDWKRSYRAGHGVY